MLNASVPLGKSFERVIPVVDSSPTVSLLGSITPVALIIDSVITSTEHKTFFVPEL